LEQLYPKKGGLTVLVFFYPINFKAHCTINYHPNNYIIEDLSHSWATPLKIRDDWGDQDTVAIVTARVDNGF
jgi:hypothetical protein